MPTSHRNQCKISKSFSNNQTFSKKKCEKLYFYNWEQKRTRKRRMKLRCLRSRAQSDLSLPSAARKLLMKKHLLPKTCSNAKKSPLWG